MPPEKRPTIVTVIGWAWIFIGAFMCFASVLSLWVGREMDAMAQGHGGIGGAATEPFAFWRPAILAQLALSAFSVVTAVRFLRRQARARRILEVLTWLLLAWVIGFTGYVLYSFVSFDSSPVGSPMMGGAVATAIGVMVFYSVPLGVMLKCLRSAEIRQAMTKEDPQ